LLPDNSWTIRQPSIALVPANPVTGDPDTFTLTYNHGKGSPTNLFPFSGDLTWYKKNVNDADTDDPTLACQSKGGVPVDSTEISHTFSFDAEGGSSDEFVFGLIDETNSIWVGDSPAITNERPVTTGHFQVCAKMELKHGGMQVNLLETAIDVNVHLNGSGDLADAISVKLLDPKSLNPDDEIEYTVSCRQCQAAPPEINNRGDVASAKLEYCCTADDYPKSTISGMYSLSLSGKSSQNPNLEVIQSLYTDGAETAGMETFIDGPSDQDPCPPVNGIVPLLSECQKYNIFVFSMFASGDATLKGLVKLNLADTGPSSRHLRHGRGLEGEVLAPFETSVEIREEIPPEADDSGATSVGIGMSLLALAAAAL